jgi:hypothetical protein
MPVLAIAERYSIEKRDERVVLVMRQAAHGLRVAALCAVVLFVTWWIGPYGPRTVAALRGKPDVFYWIWSGFFVFVFLASLFAAPFYRKDIAITDQEVIAESAFYGSKSSQRISRARPLGVWTETIVSAGDGVMFPYRVHFLDAAGHVSGLYVEFQTRRGVEAMLHALGGSLALDIRDQPVAVAPSQHRDAAKDKDSAKR